MQASLVKAIAPVLHDFIPEILGPLVHDLSIHAGVFQGGLFLSGELLGFRLVLVHVLSLIIFIILVASHEKLMLRIHRLEIIGATGRLFDNNWPLLGRA